MELFFSRHFDPDELNFLTELFDEPDNADEKKNPFNGKGTEELPRAKNGGYKHCDFCETEDPDERIYDTIRRYYVNEYNVPMVEISIYRDGEQIGGYQRKVDRRKKNKENNSESSKGGSKFRK